MAKPKLQTNHNRRNFFGYKKSLTEEFTPVKKEELARKYRASMNIEAGLTGSDAFETYLRDRIAGPSYFSEVKIPDSSSTFTEALKESQKDAEPVIEAKQNVTNAIRKAFGGISERTKAAKEEFDITIAAMNKLIADTPPVFNPGALASHLQATKGEAVTAIKAQHKEDKDKLNQLFEDTDFTGNLKTSLGLDSDGQVENLKKELLSELGKKQAKELKQFDDVLTKTADDLHQGQNREVARIAWFANMYDNNKVMRAAIEQAQIERQKKNPEEVPTSATIGISKDRIDFKGLKVTDLQTIRTFTGRTVNYDESTGTFSVEAARGWNFIEEFLKQHRGRKDEIASIVAIVQATGATSITMEINDTDSKKAEELGRIAYESCIAAGYPPDKISVKVNGELKTEEYDPKTKKPKPGSVNKLFEGEQGRLNYAKKQAAIIAEQTKAFASTPKQDREVTARLKAEIAAMRNNSNPNGDPHSPSPISPAA